MICPECNQTFDSDRGSCPRCGAWKGVLKTSTILISAGEVSKAYRSVEEVPGPLRRRLIWSTNGMNSATIVIADRQGRKEIAKAIRGIPAGVNRNPPPLAASQAAGLEPGPPRPGMPQPMVSLVVLRSAAAMLFLAVAALAWLAFR